MNRLNGLDAFRGLAIFFMITFHFSYDLHYFGYIKIDTTQSTFFIHYRQLIVNMFLFAVGVSLAIANKNGINWHKVKKRALVLGLTSALISIATYFIFPLSWIYFGVIHFIFVASIVGLAFINRPKLALFSAIAILVAYFGFNITMHPIFIKIAPLLHIPLYHTEDLVPFIPWFSTVLLGIALVGFNLHSKLFKLNSKIAQTKPLKLLQFMGKHSLFIYLIHQPILFGIFEILLHTMQPK